jgi:hypothetical protein
MRSRFEIFTVIYAYLRAFAGICGHLTKPASAFRLFIRAVVAARSHNALYGFMLAFTVFLRTIPEAGFTISDLFCLIL